MMASPQSITNPAIVSVRNLVVRLRTDGGLRTIVDGVDYDIEPGRVLGIAGESGSGKTISMLVLLGLLGSGFVVTGTAVFAGEDLVTLGQDELRRLRGPALALVM